jgi:DNA-directed RNA polymerase sigma subunit (sigma70/sigma32)
MKELNLDEFKDVLEKSEQHHFNMSRSLLKKLEERDQEIVRLRTLLTEHGIDPKSLTRQIDMNLAELGNRFKSMNERLDNIDGSSW